MVEPGVAAMLEARGLVKRFPPGGRAAVDGVDLAVPAGGALGLVGESGSGKTTVARLVLGLLAPDAGEIRLDGRPLTGLRPRELRRRRAEMQIVFQDPLRAFNPRRTIGRSVLEPLEAAGLEPGPDRLAALLERAGLPAALGARFPHELSGGQLQRAAIARALAPGPRLLVADEPVSALDVSIQAQILELLNDLRTREGLTLLFISHDLAVVRQVADTVAVMQAGRIVEEGPVETVLHSPRHPYTRSLLEAVPEPFD